MKSSDYIVWALVAAVAATFLLVGCSGSGSSVDTVRIEIPTTKAIAGLVRSTDGVATVVYNNTVIGEKLKLTIEEDRDADAARLVVGVPSAALLGVRGAPPRRQESAGGALAVLITDPTGNTIFVSVQASVDFSSSKPTVAVLEGGIVTPDSDSDGVPNWLEVHLQTNPSNASDVPTEAAVAAANETLTQSFTEAIETGKTTTAGAEPQSSGSTPQPGETTTPSTAAATGEPNTTLTAKPGAFSKVNSVSFKFATDTGVRFECSLDGAEFAACATPLNLSALAEGRHTFKVRAVSATGTPDATPASHTWTVDTAVPSASISGLPLTPWNSANVTATLSCSEANCAFICSLDGSVAAGCSASHVMSGVADGDHTLKVFAVDDAGNEQSDPAVGAFKTDTTLPAKPDAAKVTVSQNAPGSEDQVIGTAGGVEGSAKVKVFSDGLLTDKLAETTAKADGSIDAVNIGDNKGDSTDKIYVVQIDAAGNQSAVESLANDKTPPAAATLAVKDSTSASASYTNSTTIDVTITGDTGVSGWFITEGTTPAPLATGWAATKPTALTLGSAEGSHTVKLYVKDAAHNVSTVTSASITLDLNAPGNPTLTIKDADCPTCGATSAVGVNVTIGSDTDAVAWLLSESQSTAPAESASGWAASKSVSFTLSSTDGSKTVYLWVKDAAGNINAGPISQSIILDTALPTVGTVSTANATVTVGPTTYVDGTFDISATITESGSGIATCEYSTDSGATWVAATFASGTGLCSTTTATCTGTTAMTINIRGKDNAGNVQAGTSIARTCDTTGPSAPSALTDTPASGEIGLSWTGSTDSGSGLSGTTPYVIYYDTDQPGAPYTSSATSATTNKTLSLANGYYWLAVKAQDALGNLSAYSNEVRVYLLPNAVEGVGHLKADGTMSYTTNCENGPGPEGFKNAYGAALDSTNNRLFAVDSQNNRILVFNLSPSDDFTGTGVDREADYVLGQPDFDTCTTNTQNAANGCTAAVNACGMSQPFGADYANNKLFVADEQNSRILIFDVTTITNGEAAVNVLGQPDFISSAFATTQAGLKNPTGVAVDTTNNRLWVADKGNNRVIYYGISTITNGQNSATGMVEGQWSMIEGAANKTNAGLGCTTTPNACGLGGPEDVLIDPVANRLYVSDQGNSRVLVFDTTQLDGSGGKAAILVLGQADFVSGSANRGGAIANNTLNITVGLAKSGNRLFVADSANSRVMVWDTSTMTNGSSAAKVLGQANFTSGTQGTTQSVISNPGQLVAGASLLYVGDQSNRRILQFNIGADFTTIADGEAATDGLGHLDTTGAMVYDSACINGPGPDGLSPEGGGVALDSTNHRLFVADTTNHRVLVYNLSTSDDFTGADRKADFVLGQADFAHCAANRGGTTAANSLNTPRGLLYDGANNRLYVADNLNHRVVSYGVATITNGQAAVNVLGQATWSGNALATTPAGLNRPFGMDLAGGFLYVADQLNHRVVTYNVGDGITDGEAAANVLGQPDFTTATTNTQGGCAASTPNACGLNAPFSVAIDGTNKRLFVADVNNNRVTVFDVTAIADGEAAANVLGQANLQSNAAASTRAGLNNPMWASYTGNRLFVPDGVNHRVVVYDVTSITNGEDAAQVIGQTSFTANTAATTQSGFNEPRAIHVSAAGKLYAVDRYNNRLLIFNVP